MTIQEKCREISLLLTDVDGVLTDGKLYYSHEGEAMKAFNIKDGMGVKLLQKSGITVGIVTGRKSDMVTIRASELGIEIVHQGIKDKEKTVTEIIHLLDISPAQTAYIGDDVNDLPAFSIAGLSACPADAAAKIRDIADYVCESKGGSGALREFAELILNSR
ncbi:KdsC family phosphatase [Rhodohalobacter barkolensis]|uniref:Phenylphosphate carboxylase subunit delta n=1 Tax=Rhodohalobacter barkolensis TaxID=2053187 RepID=A0A2N0VGF1_9BACT|nr:HAD-IIIA family hydrolase [Rhodohalobacter barkolensis]PKD43276.1 phenylphosphate carboxylase subunit delta [Rhodohalobacter barkolensis]